jgi:hypothetical protein
MNFLFSISFMALPALLEGPSAFCRLSIISLPFKILRSTKRLIVPWNMYCIQHYSMSGADYNLPLAELDV